MTITEYLCNKYNVVIPTTLSKIEAIAFGIPWPLSNGWLLRYGPRTVTDKALKTISYKMQDRLKKQIGKKNKRFSYTEKSIEICKTGIQNKKPIKYEFFNVVTDDFLQTFEWRKLRMVALKKYGAQCQCCGASPNTGAVMNVDHIKPRRIYPELALELSNLQVLCNACNHGKGSWDDTDWRKKEENQYDPIDDFNKRF